MKRLMGMMLLMVGFILVISPLAEACGVIEIDRRPLPPDTPVTNISVQKTALDVRIEDQVAVVTVDEIFHNPNPYRLEGTFLLPVLPETALQDLSLWINGQENKGELLDRDKALQYYQETVRKMIDPALLEYAAYGLLKLRVFPIPPANQDLGQGPGNIRIKYTYTYRLPSENGVCAFRHPWGTNKFSQEPIDSAVIKAVIKSKVPLKTVYSPTYPAIEVSRKNDNEATISFEQTKMKPDKDFILYYTLSEKQFGVNLVTYKKSSADGFLMMMLSPKYEMKDNEVVKKDVIFVLDTSGSMEADEKLAQAKNALNFCIGALRESDRFNLITFSGEVRTFKDKLQEVTPAIRDEARNWVKDIEARGATDIDGALQTALGMVDKDSKRPVMVVFLTDGMPTMGEQNPEQILKNIGAKNTGNVRIFTFGVGFDVNTHLLDKLAEGNHGAREYVTPGENIEVKVSNFYEKIAYPVLADVKVAFSGIEVYDYYPHNLPDLFRGSQMVIFGRYKGDGPHLITLTGVVNGEARKFEYEATFASASETADFIPRLWATSKIGYLLDDMRLHGENKEVKEEIVKLAREYGILTPYTSWLVLEDIKTNPRQGQDIPVFNSPPPLDAINGLKDKAEEWHQKSGGGAVAASKENKKLEEGQWGFSADDEVLGRKAGDIIRQVGDKTFYFNNGIWYDSQYDEKAKDKVQLKYLSPEYFDLIKNQPALAKYLALGEQVTVCWNGKVYEITNPEEKK